MKRGCNQTATGAESVAVVVAAGPGPAPAIKLRAPIEVVTAEGVDAMIGTQPEDGVTYTWSTGESGPMIWAKADASKVLTLTGTKNGARVVQTISLVVQ
jgi:hypothetical protein